MPWFKSLFLPLPAAAPGPEVQRSAPQPPARVSIWSGQAGGAPGPPAPSSPPHAPCTPLLPRPLRSSARPPAPALSQGSGEASGGQVQARAGGGPRAPCAPGWAPRAHFGDGFAAGAAEPSPSLPPAASSRTPATSLRRLQPRRGQPYRVLWPRGKLLRLRGGFFRAQRVFEDVSSGGSSQSKHYSAWDCRRRASPQM